MADWEPRDAVFAGADGLDAVALIVTEVSQWLAPGGAVVVEIDPRQVSPAIDLAVAGGLVDVVVLDDLSSRPRILLGRRPA